MSEDRYRVEPLDRTHDRAAFSCGNADRDRYLHQQARQDMTRRVAAVFVLRDLTNDQILGYYTLSAGMVKPSDLPPEMARKLPRYDMLPVTVLGRLAISNSLQGQGFGGFLLAHALRLALRQSSQIAAFAVVVDARDGAARRFYERFGFTHLPDQPFRLFIPMSLIERSGQTDE